MILEGKKERLRKSYNLQKCPISCRGGCDHSAYKPDSKKESNTSKIKRVCALGVISRALDALRTTTWTQAPSQRQLV